MSYSKSSKREKELLKIQQEREGGIQNPARERRSCSKSSKRARRRYSKSSKREKDLLKIQQEREGEKREREGESERALEAMEEDAMMDVAEDGAPMFGGGGGNNGLGSEAVFAPMHTSGMVLCCLCGASISPNPANMCASCLRTQVDVTEGIPRSCSLTWCKSCERYLQPPKHWTNAQLESAELLTLCLKRIRGLGKVRLTDAAFVWTEPHSRRIKVRLTVQSEVLSGTILEQSFVVEFVVEPALCPVCIRDTVGMEQWNACVQLRQKVSHKRTFLFLEQVILKHGAQRDALGVKQMAEGLDFYFVSRSHALRFIDFLSNVSPIRHRHDKQLVSHNEHESSYTYKFTFSVEIVPVCKDDLVLLPKKLASSLGNIGPLVLCTRVSNIIQLIDPATLHVANITANQYWGGGNNTNINSNPIILMSGRQLTEFTVIESSSDYSAAGARGKWRACEVHCCRSERLGVDGSMRYVRSHLGNVLGGDGGELVLGYDVHGANFSGIDNRELERQLKVGLIPDVVLVRKHYGARRYADTGDAMDTGNYQRRRRRRWKLRRMQVEVEEGNSKRYTAADDEYDTEQFYRELEEDPEMRAMVNMFKDTSIADNDPASGTARANAMASGDNDGGGDDDDDDDDDDAPEVPIEELLDGLGIDDEVVVGQQGAGGSRTEEKEGGD